jgi:peptide deformylase
MNGRIAVQPSCNPAILQILPFIITHGYSEGRAHGASCAACQPRRSTRRKSRAPTTQADRRHDPHDGRYSASFAPQARGARIFVAALDAAEDTEEAEPVVLINPEISVIGSDVIDDWEGCLSIPDIRGRVPRAREIRVKAYDRHGDRIELRASEFPARVIQHENDHLDGVLFFDRMRSFESLTFLDEYSRYWAREKD